MVGQNPETSPRSIHRIDVKRAEDGVLEMHPGWGTSFDVTATYASVVATLNSEPVRLVHNIPVTLDASHFRHYAEQQSPHAYVDTFLAEKLTASGHQIVLDEMSVVERTAAYWTAAEAIAAYFNPKSS